MTFPVSAICYVIDDSGDIRSMAWLAYCALPTSTVANCYVEMTMAAAVRRSLVITARLSMVS